jgi:hypothetical protein
MTAPQVGQVVLGLSVIKLCGWLCGSFVELRKVLVVDVQLPTLSASDLAENPGLLQAANRRIDRRITEIEIFSGDRRSEDDDACGQVMYPGCGSGATSKLLVNLAPVPFDHVDKVACGCGRGLGYLNHALEEER